jgi:hypothetical protein
MHSNHELWQNFTAYKARFSMPNPEFENMRHVYNVGPVHFLNLNTETWVDTADLDPDQVAWMTEDLEGVNRTALPWVIVTGHRPFYCSNHNTLQCEVFTALLRSQGEAVLAANRVDLVINAHEHNMELSYPLFNGTAVADNFVSPKGEQCH